MSAELIDLAKSYGPVVAAIVAGWFAFRKDRPAQKTASTDAFIARLIEVGEANGKEFTELQARVDQLEKIGRLKDNFIFVLIKHINDGLGPPAPKWPDNLLP